MIQCTCGKKLEMPAFPHKDNTCDVQFPTNETVVVALQCDCGQYLTTTYELTEIETIIEEEEGETDG